MSYLDKVRKLIPSVFFVLNKVDLLDAAERRVAERFLADVLAERRPTEPSDRIFALSARQGLRAKLANDAARWRRAGCRVWNVCSPESSPATSARSFGDGTVAPDFFKANSNARRF